VLDEDADEDSLVVELREVDTVLVGAQLAMPFTPQDPAAVLHIPMSHERLAPPSLLALAGNLAPMASEFLNDLPGFALMSVKRVEKVIVDRPEMVDDLSTTSSPSRSRS
jgi:hypothetical protein